MTTGKEILLRWLRDAHAMENTAESILKRQAKRTKDHPTIHQKISEHLEVTRRQAKRVEECIERLGGDASTIKDMTGSFVGAMQAMTAAGADDELVKAAISDYAFEQFEIANYNSLIDAAEACGEVEIQRVCEEILSEEEEMADWLEEQIPEVTRGYLLEEGVEFQPGTRPPGGPSETRPRA